MPHRRMLAGPVAVRGLRRKSVWFQFAPAVNTMTAAGGTIFFSLNAAALALRPFTVVRSHFELFVTSDQEAATEDQVIGAGIAVVSDQAVAVGVSAVPTPITEMGSDLWFVHRIAYAGFILVTSGMAERGTRVSIDSKAMRKVGVGQDIVVVGEFSAAGSGVQLFIGGRMLVKLS